MNEARVPKCEDAPQIAGATPLPEESMLQNIFGGLVLQKPQKARQSITGEPG